MSKPIKIYTIDELADYCKKNNLLNFNSNDNGKSVVVSTFGKLDYEEDENDTGETMVTMKIMHTGLNRNNSSISRDLMKSKLDSFYNKPIVAEQVDVEDKDGNIVKDFGSHSFEFYTDENGNEKIHYIEQPIGHIPESATIKLQYDKKNDRTYVVVKNALIYNSYGNDAVDIIKRNNGTKVSVELELLDFEWDDKSSVLTIKDFNLIGVCCLGAKIPEGMHGARLDLSSFDLDTDSLTNVKEDEYDYRNQFAEMGTKIDTLLSYFDIKNSESTSDKNSRKEENLLEMEMNDVMLEEETPVEEVSENVVSEEVESIEDIENIENAEVNEVVTEEADETEEDEEEKSEDDSDDAVEDAEDVEDSADKEDDADEPTDDSKNKEDEEDDTIVEMAETEEVEEEKSEDDSDASKVIEEESADEVADTTESKEVVETTEMAESDETSNEENADYACGDKEEDKDKFCVSITCNNKSFELSLCETTWELERLVNETYCDTDCTYYCVEAFDGYVIMRSFDTKKCFKESYSKENDIITLGDDRIEVFPVYLTKEELDMVESDKTELEELREYKSNIEADKVNAEKEEIISDDKYSCLNDNANFKELISNKANYSAADLEKEIKVIYADYVMNNGTPVNETKKKAFGGLFMSASKADKPSKKKAYNGLFENL